MDNPSGPPPLDEFGQPIQQPFAPMGQGFDPENPQGQPPPSQHPFEGGCVPPPMPLVREFEYMAPPPFHGAEVHHDQVAFGAPPPGEKPCETGHDHRLVELNVVHVKPKYLLKYMSMVPQGMQLVERCGAKVLGKWTVEGGGGPTEVIYMSEFANLQERAACIERMVSDLEWQHFANQTLRFIYGVQNFLMAPALGCTFRQIPPDAKLVMKTLSPKVPSAEAACKWKEMCASVRQQVPTFPEPFGLLAPVFAEKLGMFSFYPCPENNPDFLLEAARNIQKDSQNWPQLSEYASIVHEEARRLLVPLCPEKFPKAESCPLQ